MQEDPTTQPTSQEILVARISERCGDIITSASVSLDHPVITIDRASALQCFYILKTDRSLDFSMLLDVTGVDYLDKKEDRFEVVYHLLSIKHKHRVRVKISAPESNPEVDSVTELWASANVLECETWDMYGIVFKNHPDLRRVLMYPEFVGHPLRKDYPVQGKQPRVPLRSPEVKNSARDMTRSALSSGALVGSPLVAINKRAQK